ncbi:MAG TPA: AAA family ATPase [Candidatus Mediterraneibacter merdavium]|nr:AAA family ATPase [Candidatus Mediterraneibacter merdavium]
MVIKELYVKNFGKLTERHFYLRDGLQVISGENEFGKSTLHAFIRAMLFGLERGRGRAAAKDDFTRYEPWDSPGNYAGVMRFSCGGRAFRLERSFDRYTKRASLVCEDDGEELSVEQGDLDMLLGGLTPGVFDSTVSVGQLQVEPGQELYDALENYAVNYFETGSGEIDLAAAFRLLKDKKRSVAKAVKEEDTEQEAQRDKLLAEISYLERDIDGIRSEYAQKEEELADIKRELAADRDFNGQRGPAREMDTGDGDGGSPAGSRNLILTGLGGLFAGAAGFLWSTFLGSRGEAVNFLTVGVIAGAVALIGFLCLAGGCVMWLRERNSRKLRGRGGGLREQKEDCRQKERIKSADKETARTGKEEQISRIQWEMGHLLSEQKEKEIRRDNIREEWAECGISDIRKKLCQSLRALELAEETLRQSAKETGDAGADAMKRKASKILAQITEGRYQGIELDGERRLSVWDGVRRIPAERLSRGTIEQIYLSVRLAAAELLLEEEIPLIFDDAFAFYDDKRLESALKWLSRSGKQVIIFTCQNREEEIVNKLRG